MPVEKILQFLFWNQFWRARDNVTVTKRTVQIERHQFLGLFKGREYRMPRVITVGVRSRNSVEFNPFPETAAAIYLSIYYVWLRSAWYIFSSSVFFLFFFA